MNKLITPQAMTPRSAIPVGHTLDTARAIACDFLRQSHPLGATYMPLDIAAGRILASQSLAAQDLPRFDTALVDGYAICFEDLRGKGPWHLRVSGTQDPGDKPLDAPRKGTGKAVAVATGAAVPGFADAVVSTEAAVREGMCLTILQRPTPGEHIHQAGEAILAGKPIAPSATILTARHVGLLAAMGQDRVQVRSKLKTAVLSVGAGLSEPGGRLRGTQVFDANRALLKAQLQQKWIGVTDLGIVKDDVHTLSMALRFAAESNRIIISTGGASRGSADLLATAIEAAGGNVLVRGIAMRPGKSTLIGSIDESLVIGLPGNPVAAWIGMSVLGLDAARAAAGLAPVAPKLLSGRSAFAYEPAPGRLDMPLICAQPSADGLPRLTLAHDSGTPNLVGLAAADGLALIGPNSAPITRGATVTWIKATTP